MSEATNEKLREGYHVFGGVVCEYCNERVDLSEADGVNEAAKVWNEHLNSEHPDRSSGKE